MSHSEASLFEASGKTLRVAKPVGELLTQMLDSMLVLQEDWELLSGEVRDLVLQCVDISELLRLLQEHGLLTEYQAERIEAGTVHGLVLGNYRVLGRLGAGAMGVVFRAEHYR